MSIVSLSDFLSELGFFHKLLDSVCHSASSSSNKTQPIPLAPVACPGRLAGFFQTFPFRALYIPNGTPRADQLTIIMALR